MTSPMNSSGIVTSTRIIGSSTTGLAFSTAEAGELHNDRLDPFFAAAYEAGHEAVYNCLVAARPAVRLDVSMQEGFPVDAVRR